MLLGSVLLIPVLLTLSLTIGDGVVEELSFVVPKSQTTGDI